MNHALTRKAGLLSAAALVLALLGPAPAMAQTLSGSKNCPGQFGYLTATTVGTTRLVPPGSVYVWAYWDGGTRTRIAAWSNGESKQGGGPWSAYGSSSVRNTNPFCGNAG